MTRFWRRTRARERSPPTDGLRRDRLEQLEARVKRLEVTIEGLQDAVYRKDVLHDRELDELRNRTQPGQIARDLSDDARKRGL
jgi:hypothetical protein